MSSKATPSTKKLKVTSPEEDLKPTWGQQYADFAITLSSGRVLMCHKFLLAQNSSVFDSMLKSELTESRANTMKIDGFDDKTVFHFLEYIYARFKHVDAEHKTRRQ